MLLMELEWLGFEWDEAKNGWTLDVRGFDFVFASFIFSGPVLLRADDRRDYGEARWIATGAIEGVTLTVVYTVRPVEICRIISARRASREEREAYREALAGRSGA
ncbi:BrnT family toxin [Caenispirillum bisanense]|uniref:BrnT family toxin n=1 Tax=Caenispirillum bisanense TaxID=414052 RepID=UPI0031E3C1C7